MGISSPARHSGLSLFVLKSNDRWEKQLGAINWIFENKQKCLKWSQSWFSSKYLWYSCEASDFSHKPGDTVWNFVKTESFRPRKTSWNTMNLNNFRWHLTVFPSDFNNIYLKYFGLLQSLTRNYEIVWKFMKAMIFHNIFLFKSLAFILFLFNCDVLFAFCNFVLWWTKFFCLLLYRFSSRQYWQIFRHCQMIGDISNIADTYSWVTISSDYHVSGPNFFVLL